MQCSALRSRTRPNTVGRHRSVHVNSILKLLRRTMLLLVVIIIALAGYVYVRSEWRLQTSYNKTLTTLSIPADSASIARGDHLFHATISCALCHGDDCGG